MFFFVFFLKGTKAGDAVYTVKAHKEVVVCGGYILEALLGTVLMLSIGAVNSPQLLMVSGVGPKAHLAEHGIPLVADVPGVGKNLQDHILAFLCRCIGF